MLGAPIAKPTALLGRSQAPKQIASPRIDIVRIFLELQVYGY